MSSRVLRSSTALTPGGSGNPLKDDFRLFLTVVWKGGFIPGNPDPTDIQFDIAQFLQHGPSRMVIEAFRGVGKSWITSAFVCWLLYRDPNLNILVVSASKQRADDFSTFTLRLIRELPILRHLIPRKDQRMSKVAFDVAGAAASHSASVRSAGITGQITGSRADVIIADDVEVPSNSATEGMREKLAHTIKEFDSILKPHEGARIIYLGTPQTEQSIYNRLPDRGYTIRVWPARYPKDVEKYGDRLAPLLTRRLLRKADLALSPTDPHRFHESDLAARETSVGRSTFALQFMLDTTLSDADRYPLKMSDLVVMDIDLDRAPNELSYGTGPELVVKDLPNVGFDGDRCHRPFYVSKDWSPYTGIVMALDPSGRGGDETGYAIIGNLFGRLYVMDAGAIPGGYSDSALEAIGRLAKRYKVNWVTVEPNFGDGMFTALLKPVLAKIHPCVIEESDWSRSQKEARIIDTLEPVINQHRLIVDRALIQRDYDSTLDKPPEDQNAFRLFYQLTHITRDRGCLRKDDRVDALALSVRFWLDRMDIDVQKAAEARREDLLEQELRSFADTFGRQNTKKSVAVIGDGWGGTEGVSMI